MTQPTVLRLADTLNDRVLDIHAKLAAAELRRLHGVNQELVEALEDAVLIFTPSAKDCTSANVIDKAMAALAKARGTE